MLSVHTSPLDQPGTGDAGGMNVYVLELSRALAARGARVEIFTRATSSDQPETGPAARCRRARAARRRRRRPHGPARRRGRSRRDAADPRAPRARRPVRAAGQERPAGRPVRHGRGRAALGGRAPARLVRRRALPLLALRAGRPDRGGPLGGAARAHRPHARPREERVAGPRRHPRADRARGRRGAARRRGRRPRGQHARSRPRSWSSSTAPTPRACTSSSPGVDLDRFVPGRPAGGAALARAAHRPPDRALRRPRAGAQGAGRAGQRAGRAAGDRAGRSRCSSCSAARRDGPAPSRSSRRSRRWPGSPTTSSCTRRPTATPSRAGTTRPTSSRCRRAASRSGSSPPRPRPAVSR